MALTLNHVVVLVGGVGGAKLAYGLKEILRPEQLTVIVNTGDDFWHYGLRICPDLDTITYTLSGVVDRLNGWGIANDTTRTLDALQRFDEDAWFRLGDIDLATHLLRTNMLRNGDTLTEVTTHIKSKLGIEHLILPMTDDEVATIVHTDDGELAFQDYFVRHRWQPVVTRLEYRGASDATLSPVVLDAIMEADAIIIGPSNPWLSIAPILDIGSMKSKLLEKRDVPRIAVSPIVGGKAIKGPTAKIMGELGLSPTAKNVAHYYGELINGFVYDRQDSDLHIDGLRTLVAQTIMKTDHDKIALAEEIIDWLEHWS